MRLNRRYHDRFRLSAILVALALTGPSAALAEAKESQSSAEATPLADLSLEELMNVRLARESIHTHDAGEVMTGYSYMFMDMGGNLDGTSGVSTRGVFSRGYMVAPLAMSMQMHMFHAMWAPSDVVTLALMMPYLKKSMDHRVNPGAPVPFAGTKFRTESEGPGDLKLAVLVSALDDEQHQLIGTLGWSFPTGSIDERDDVPMSPGGDTRLPYPMQLGSGTFDALPGITYIGESDHWSWGTDARGVLRIGENHRDYTLGHEWSVTGWTTRNLTSWLSASLRLRGRGWGNIDGADPALNPNMVPTADPNLRAGKRLDLLFGLNVFPADSMLDGNQITLEGGLPVYQTLTGPQLRTRWQLRVAWEFTFSTPFALGGL